MKQQLADLNSAISAINKCSARASSGSSTASDDPCTVIKGSSAQVSERIANGKFCGDSTSPVVFVELFDSDGGDAGFCSGTVVGSHTVLTAGHCFEDGEAGATVVVGGQEIAASRIMVHPQYSKNNDDFQFHDMTLLKFDAALPVRAMGFVQAKTVELGDTGIIAGYGDDENGGSERLRAAKVNVTRVDNNGIEIKYFQDSTTGNTCEGDSGGPLLVKRDNKWIVAGVTSNGDATTCGDDDTSRFSNLARPENIAFLLANLS